MGGEHDHLADLAVMNDTRYTEYAVRAMERKLKTERKLYNTEALVLTTLKAWAAYKPVDDIEEKLNQLADNPFERQLAKNLCLRLWITKMRFKKSSPLKRLAARRKRG